MNPQQIPNIITCFRILLIAPVIWGLMTSNYLLAFYSFIIAGCSDGVDGLLARQCGWTSRFGSIADPLADKLLLMSSFIALSWLNTIPIWLLYLVIFRDLWILTGAIAYHVVIGQPEFTPSLISKINTFFQILLVTLVLFQLCYDVFPASLFNSVMYVVLMTTLVSLFDYTWVWGKRAYQNKLRTLTRSN